MVVTVTLPAALLRAADRLTRRVRRSRSEVISAAVAEYIARHNPKAVTDALDRLASRLETKLDEPLSAASRRRL